MANAGTVRALWVALRPYQWSKNLVLFAAPIFAQQIHLPEQAIRSLGAFTVFCALSSATYLFNDVLDLKEDRVHPVKRYRPLASGALSGGLARAASLVLLVGALAAAALLGRMFFSAALLYVVLQLAYSLALKNVAILDVLAIAVGFVLRALAGALAVNVEFTNWLVVCSLFLALFLALGKRRSELALVQQGFQNGRKVLIQYTPQFVDTLLTVSATAALLTFTIYTCSPETVARIGTDKMYVTLPLVVYGLFRYFWLINEGQGDDPSRIVVRDVPLALTVLAWVLLSMALLYSDGTGGAPGGLFFPSG
jgi:4-hydroxybenzoate polyprenyltransferase